MTIEHKIQKLLSLAERAGTEAEAAAAMNAVQVLLAKHNLSMGDVESFDAEPEERISEDESMAAGLRGQAWKDLVFNQIAQLYFCQVFARREIRGGRTVSRRYRIIGKPSNIAVVKYMAAYMVNTVDALVRDAVFTARREQGAAFDARAWSASFRVGFAVRLKQRVQEQIAAAKAGKVADGETGRALTLAPLYNQEQTAIAAYIADQNIRVRNARGSVTVRDRAGYQAGSAAANNVSLTGNGVSHEARKAIA